MKKMNKKGQALVEYVVIIGVVTVLIIALVNYFGGYLKDSITKSSCPLIGEEFVPGSKPGEGTCGTATNSGTTNNNNNIIPGFGY